MVHRCLNRQDDVLVCWVSGSFPSAAPAVTGSIVSSRDSLNPQLKILFYGFPLLNMGRFTSFASPASNRFQPPASTGTSGENLYCGRTSTDCSLGAHALSWVQTPGSSSEATRCRPVLEQEERLAGHNISLRPYCIARPPLCSPLLTAFRFRDMFIV